MNITENIERILQDKVQIAQAISDKGVACTVDESLDLFADKISQISAGGGGTDAGSLTPEERFNIFMHVLEHEFFEKELFTSITVDSDLYDINSRGYNMFNYYQELFKNITYAKIINLPPSNFALFRFMKQLETIDLRSMSFDDLFVTNGYYHTTKFFDDTSTTYDNLKYILLDKDVFQRYIDENDGQLGIYKYASTTRSLCYWVDDDGNYHSEPAIIKSFLNKNTVFGFSLGDNSIHYNNWQNETTWNDNISSSKIVSTDSNGVFLSSSSNWWLNYIDITEDGNYTFTYTEGLENDKMSQLAIYDDKVKNEPVKITPGNYTTPDSTTVTLTVGRYYILQHVRTPLTSDYVLTMNISKS